MLERGVFLDLGSVSNRDLDLGLLEAALPEWRMHEFTEAADCAGRIAGAQVVISNKCRLDRGTLGDASDLKLIAVAATGTNNVDLEAAREFGIGVCNARDYATEAVTQHVTALILNLVTGQAFYRDRVRAGDWSSQPQFSLFDRPIREVSGLTLGIVGFGVLGRSVAGRAKQMGMNILVAERKGHPPRGDHLPFMDVVAHADVISIHCPLNEETRGLFDRGVMERMKPDAILLNTARGGIVDEADLAACLREGIIGGAGVDVLTEEPPPADHPLLAHDIPNLVVTPHNAWASRKARQALVDQLAHVIHAFERGQPVNRVA
ncbi:MAG: glycerate dehydrogenase [Xanthomonadales bacterium]|nr:D-2-hydroxyacid dehydrogenase [Xanthomonadales bacterium]NIX12916.1 glycerate dehydrogenase [Xanthomonadales bacterium]